MPNKNFQGTAPAAQPLKLALHGKTNIEYKMSRNDISENLVHWIKGDSFEGAFETLLKIVYGWELTGSNGFIKGGYNCVCFTEAPVDEFHSVTGKYKPFGILLSKKFVFSIGGRPVIYQHDSEYSILPDEIKWRHVRYEPCSEEFRDFTWEREWRVHTDCFELPPEEVTVLVPDQTWVDAIHKHQYYREQHRIYAEAVAYGDIAQWQAPDEFHYRVSAISV